MKKNSVEDTNEDNNYDIIEGRNAVLEAIKSHRDIDTLLLAQGTKDAFARQIMQLSKQHNIVLKIVDRMKLDQISSTNSHQGIVAFVAQKNYVDIDDILDKASLNHEKMFLLILDHINDPYNFGSILRSANAVGVNGVIIPKRRAAGLTSTVAKSSAGAIEYVPVARVSNIAQTIDYLKSKDIWVIGTDSDATETFYNTNYLDNIALVVGNEGDGISRLVKEKCDFMVKIPMTGQIGCLNVSVASSIIMYEVFRQRNYAKK